MSNQMHDENRATIDRLALSRAQHFQSNYKRLTSISHNNNNNNDHHEQIESMSDWSESACESYSLSDFDLASNHDEIPMNISNDGLVDHDHDSYEKTTIESKLFEHMPIVCETRAYAATYDVHEDNRQLTYANDIERLHVRVKPNSRRTTVLPAPLLPARRIQSKQSSNVHLSANTPVLGSMHVQARSRKTTSSPYGLHREITSTSTNSNQTLRHDSLASIPSRLSKNDDIHQSPLPVTSPLPSHTSMSNACVSRIYELKKSFVDDYDYGRLTQSSAVKTIPERNRQKWGTIVHPPFPLGYQQVTSEQVTHVVQRLSSPVRTRDRRTPVQTPSKRYLSVEETDALVCQWIRLVSSLIVVRLDQSTNESQAHTFIRSICIESIVVEASQVIL
jgi:hypothetical protein